MFEFVKKNADTGIFLNSVIHDFFPHFCKVTTIHVLIQNRICSVPNAFVCMEIKTVIKILSLTHFFKQTAIILNTTVHELHSVCICIKTRCTKNIVGTKMSLQLEVGHFDLKFPCLVL